ncbi:SOS response-associated peptidase [Mucilaginibacter sp. Bleaf8]|uniref:SOS response-associated peptidase n=1 Tax=Mucilaginibacter sp. Bleaf8 TaxID=2834430 RepID=UPI001BCB62B6|nr:SOS response-associated peptidase [Mucilaginibacter sp. Bleaf8]MBS7564647.1 SOS response-associated peptidase [Mucilaginibacter sp. Bleaf8]
MLTPRPNPDANNPAFVGLLNKEVMCARYSLSKDTQIIETEYTAKVIDPFAPSYNTAPTMNSAVITSGRPDEVQQYHFGLVPFWAQDTKIGLKMFNARAETLLELPSFKPLMEKNRRCLVLADGFYEWEKAGNEKLPHRFTLLNQPVFAFAGLYSYWKDKKTGEGYPSFTIITTASNKTVGQLHNRMPVILSKEYESLWLANDIPMKDLTQLLTPYPDDEMEMYRVSKEVNVARNNHAGLIAPLLNSQ